jgi:hypothetical protein
MSIPTAALRAGRREQQRRGDQAEAEAGRGLQRGTRDHRGARGGGEKGDVGHNGSMAWDFSTDPDFQAQLDWMSAFVREEVWPIETIFDELGQDGFDAAIAPLQAQVRERGLWAAHLPPELGGQGFGQVKLG